MQNMQLSDDVAPLISRFPPESGLSMQRDAPPAAILAQMLRQLVARFLRFLEGSCWAICWAFCCGQPCRSAAKSYRRIGASSRRCPGSQWEHFHQTIPQRRHRHAYFFTRCLACGCGGG
jgi:hypothetical protein